MPNNKKSHNHCDIVNCICDSSSEEWAFDGGRCLCVDCIKVIEECEGLRLRFSLCLMR